MITDYRFHEDNELSVRNYAETDCATYIKRTNHAYFNWRGNGKKITEHRLHISSDRILDNTSAFIPTGRTVSYTHLGRMADALALGGDEGRDKRR